MRDVMSSPRAKAAVRLALDEDLFGRIRATLPESDRIDSLLKTARTRLDNLRKSNQPA